MAWTWHCSTPPACSPPRNPARSRSGSATPGSITGNPRFSGSSFDQGSATFSERLFSAVPVSAYLVNTSWFPYQASAFPPDVQRVQILKAASRAGPGGILTVRGRLSDC
jgi:hypothetical protein